MNNDAGNGDSASFSILSPPFNEGEKFMDKANTIINDLNDERNKVHLIAYVFWELRGHGT